MTHLERALKEHNATLPAWKPVYRYDQLTAADRSRVDERAMELELRDLLKLIEETVGGGLR